MELYQIIIALSAASICVLIGIQTYVSYQIVMIKEKTNVESIQSMLRINDELHKANDKLRKEMDDAQAALIRLTRKGIDATAFAISSEGIKLLPKDWKTRWYK